MAVRGYGFRLECSLDNTNWVQISDLQELGVPSISKDTIESTDRDSQGIRSFIGGIVDFGELTFSTNFQYRSGWDFVDFPNDNVNHTVYLGEEINVNGTFQDTDQGGVGDSGWLADGGGGFSINASNQAVLDLSSDSSNPSYLTRTNSGGLPSQRGNVYSLQYIVNAQSGTGGTLKWEYSGSHSSNQYYTSSNGYGEHRTYNLPMTTGIHNTGATFNDSNTFKLYWAGASTSTASITLSSIKLFKLYTWHQLLTLNKTIYFRIKDAKQSFNVVATFTGFLTSVEKETPIDDVQTITITAKPHGAVQY